MREHAVVVLVVIRRLLHDVLLDLTRLGCSTFTNRYLKDLRSEYLRRLRASTGVYGGGDLVRILCMCRDDVG